MEKPVRLTIQWATIGSVEEETNVVHCAQRNNKRSVCRMKTDILFGYTVFHSSFQFSAKKKQEKRSRMSALCVFWRILCCFVVSVAEWKHFLSNLLRSATSFLVWVFGVWFSFRFNNKHWDDKYNMYRWNTKYEGIQKEQNFVKLIISYDTFDVNADRNFLRFSGNEPFGIKFKGWQCIYAYLTSYTQ